MAELPSSQEALQERFGPHLAYTPPGGWEARGGAGAPELVKTHCCFCGMQCGIQLKVKDNQVIGFEPWEEFPFNQGMLIGQHGGQRQINHLGLSEDDFANFSPSPSQRFSESGHRI